MDKKPIRELLETFRGLKPDELNEQRQKLVEDIGLMRFKNKSSQLDDLGAYRRAKKNYARLLTVIKQKQVKQSEGA